MTENRLVKEQLEYLRSFVSQAVQVSLTPAAVSGGPLQMPAPLSAALAGAIPASLLGIGSPLAGALSSSLPSQAGPGRPSSSLPGPSSPSLSLTPGKLAFGSSTGQHFGNRGGALGYPTSAGSAFGTTSSSLPLSHQSASSSSSSYGRSQPGDPHGHRIL